MTLTELGLLTVELLDSNVSGRYIRVEGSITSQDDHAGYLMLANVETPDPSSKFFVAGPAEPAGGGAGAAVLVAHAGRGKRRARAAGRRGYKGPHRGDPRRDRQVT